MPIKLSRYGQSIFDITAENFGSLDNLSDVIKDNRVPLTARILPNTPFLINSENLGDADIKKAIISQGLSFNNKYEAANTLTWDGTGVTFDNNQITWDATQ